MGISTGRNKGHEYEDKIKDLLKSRNLLPINLKNNDAGFIHKKMEYYLEVKDKKAPDFGQKELKWSIDRGWEWAKPDTITELYDQIGVIATIDPTFIPRKFTVDRVNLTEADKKFDQIKFEKTIPLSDKTYIHKYYARKKCYYIQIENRGFYYLEKDTANLLVPKFEPDLSLRFRAKFRGGTKISNYGFLVVLKVNIKSICRNSFDLEVKQGKNFPPIFP